MGTKINQNKYVKKSVVMSMFAADSQTLSTAVHVHRELVATLSSSVSQNISEATHTHTYMGLPVMSELALGPTQPPIQ